MVALPNQPTVDFNPETGDIHFVSQNNGDIIVDHYQVMVTDVTSLTVTNNTYPAGVNHATTNKSVYRSDCGPYFAHVQAHTSFAGFSESIFPIPSLSEPGGIIK